LQRGIHSFSVCENHDQYSAILVRSGTADSAALSPAACATTSDCPDTACSYAGAVPDLFAEFVGTFSLVLLAPALTTTAA
jgi:glycerol uptake facilitator-like aquaporin